MKNFVFDIIAGAFSFQKNTKDRVNYIHQRLKDIYLSELNWSVVIIKLGSDASLTFTSTNKFKFKCNYQGYLIRVYATKRDK